MYWSEKFTVGYPADVSGGGVQGNKISKQESSLEQTRQQ